MDGQRSAPVDVVGDDEARLVRRAALGDRSAFAEIFEEHAAGMFRYAVHMLDGDVGEAEDVVQTALAKAWQKLPDFERRSSLRTWLFRITANEALAHRRRRRPVPVNDALLASRPAGLGSEPHQQVVADQIWQSLAMALTELPWRQRASWLLFEMEGLSYREIARVLETSETVVRGQLHRARRTLAHRMEQWQ